MHRSTRIALANSLLFISDPDGGEGPDFVAGRLILATPSCISVGCLNFAGGETEVTLGPAQEVDPGKGPAFDGDLETPHHAVVVSTVERKTFLEATVPESSTRVRIWVNHPIEPDNVIIGFGVGLSPAPGGRHRSAPAAGAVLHHPNSTLTLS
jgi:hypothetical protein